MLDGLCKFLLAEMQQVPPSVGIGRLARLLEIAAADALSWCEFEAELLAQAAHRAGSDEDGHMSRLFGIGVHRRSANR